MNHQKIKQEKIIERYIGGKLTKKEERAFEEHYFGCDQCFEAVKEMAKTTEDSREVTEGAQFFNPLKRAFFSLLDWLKSLFQIPVPVPTMAIATIVLLALLYPAYRGIFTVKRLKQQMNQPRANVPIYYLEKTKDARESVLMEIKLEEPNETFVLNFNIHGREIETAKFRAEIMDQNGKVMWQNDDLQGLGEYEVFSIAFLGSFFKARNYILKVYEIDSETQQKANEFSFPFKIVYR